MTSPRTSNKTFTGCPSRAGPPRIRQPGIKLARLSLGFQRLPVLPGNLGTYLRRVTPANQKAVDPTRFCVGPTPIIPPLGGSTSLPHLGAARELLLYDLPRQGFPHAALLELDGDPPRPVPPRLLAGLYPRELGVVEIAELLETMYDDFYGLIYVPVTPQSLPDLGLRPRPVP